MARDPFSFVAPPDSINFEVLELVFVAWVDGRLVRLVVSASELNRLWTAPVHAEVELRVLSFDTVEAVLPVPPLTDTVDHDHVIPGCTQDKPTIHLLFQPSE